MTESAPTIADEIERYLRTGETDPHHTAWSGGFIERARLAHDDLRHALAREVARLSAGHAHAPVPTTDVVGFTRTKIEAMVRGLFPRDEQPAVLTLLERSVVFLTSESIGRLLEESDWPRSAWTIANIYLESMDADLLGPDAPSLVGLSEETTCYVSTEYFAETGPFDDFIVHEAAHVFHNCKRRTVGLPETRRREWLLDIEYRKRETFAYSCEAYARILERARTASERQSLGIEYGASARISDERVDSVEVADIVGEATAARNGWRIILRRCAPASRQVRAATPPPLIF